MRKFLFFLIASCLTQSAHASEGLLNKLLSPGPLMQGHRELERADCLKCHELNKGVPDVKCLDCHKEIRKNVIEKSGYHGLMDKRCISCHSDHKGKDFDSTKIDLQAFDHKLTGYKLAGKHATISCQECHQETRAKMATRKNDIHFIALPTSCAECHKKDDIHKFSGKYKTMACNECHTEKTWNKDVKFNHDKDTSYVLEGKHQELKCVDCHKNEKTGLYKYKFPELKDRQCLSCHEDQHKEKFGKKFQSGDCLQCHTMKSWKLTKFDHDTTGYPLKGKHADVTCIDCHKQTDKASLGKDLNYKGLRQDCLACHDNFHKFSAAPGRKIGELNTCTACHTEASWRSSFDHNKDTAYKISGKHLGLKCNDCHTPNTANKAFRQYNWPKLSEKTCENCHRSPHKETFSKENLEKKCTDCHSDTGWRLSKGTKFDHDSLTRFPLEGKHREISCKSCHEVNTKEVYSFPSFDKKFCIDCHAGPHKGQFSEKFQHNACAECHNSNSFLDRIPFKHSATRFELTGKHSSLKCDACHIPTIDRFSVKPFRFKSKFVFDHKNKGFCLDCHFNVHHDQFHEKFSQRACLQCHTTQTFEKQKPFDHFETSFPLKGMHRELSCTQCHTQTKTFFPSSTNHMNRYIFNFPQGECIGCHKDPHRDAYGKQCASCHQEDYWKNIKSFHKNFTLTGVHQSLSCTECHTDNRKLTGMNGNCFSCHQKDDVHRGALQNCGECHRQVLWENPKFQHGLTRFALRGAHRVLDCNSCHANGIYKGLPNNCVDCHLSEALAFPGSPNHSLLLNRSCTECHNQFSFR